MLGDSNPMRRLDLARREIFRRKCRERLRRLWADPAYRSQMIQAHVGKTYPTASLKKRGQIPWNKTETQISCLICGTPFHVPPARSRRIGALSPKYCSAKCHRLARLNQKFPHRNTSIERAIQVALAERGYQFETNVGIDGVCQPDIIFRDQRVLVFCDGDYWHNRPDVRSKDITQEMILRANDWKVLRFWEHEINTDVSACIAKICAAL